MYIDERHFVKTATQKLDFLEQVWTAPETIGNAERTEQTRSALDAIKLTSASVQARGVYRSAVLCAEVLSRATPDHVIKINTALSELKRLLTLYADGLFEIDPEFAALLYQPDGLTPVDSQLKNIHAKAVQTLSPLVHLVGNSELRNALKSLMQPIKINEPRDRDLKTVSLDALIQPISNLILSEARHCGKTVTMSYAADFTDMSVKIAETTQDLLEAACLKIVSQGICKMSKSELGSTPQISLTGQTRAGAILFSISWMGMEVDAQDDAHGGLGTHLRKLEERGGSFSFNTLAMSDNPKSRHTLYITLPIAKATSSNPVTSLTRAKVEMGVGRNV